MASVPHGHFGFALRGNVGAKAFLGLEEHGPLRPFGMGMGRAQGLATLRKPIPVTCVLG